MSICNWNLSDFVFTFLRYPRFSRLPADHLHRGPTSGPRLLSSMGVVQPQTPLQSASWPRSCGAQCGSCTKHWLGAIWISCLLSIFTDSAPVPHPDFSLCQNATVGLPFQIQKEACCPPTGSRVIKNFSFAGGEFPLRTRRPAHRLTQEDIQKLNRAYQLMHDLPASDPRNLEQQRRIHCAYCNGAFLQPWNDSAPPYEQSTLQIHFTWLIWPWHRWFLYFHERILASLVGDDELAIPFWNWDNQLDQGANQIPSAYSSPNHTGLFHERGIDSLPPAVADLGIVDRVIESPAFSLAERGAALADADRRRESNLNVLHQQLVTGAGTRALFFGEPYRAGDASVDFFSPTQGLLEAGAHSAIHVWAGGDITMLGSAAGDPLFYSHHANLDRLWAVWKDLGQGRTDITDPDWLNVEFLFYDENADLVRVKAGQALDIEDGLRYKYEEVKESDRAWINYIAPKCHAWKSLAETQGWIQSTPSYNNSGFYIDTSAKIFTTRLPRPNGDEGSPNTIEVLLFENLQVNWTTFTWFHVFINLPEADSSQQALGCAEFAGALNNVSHQKHGKNKVNYKIAIGSKLEELGVHLLGEIVISIVVGKHTTIYGENLKIIKEPI